jgi:hypothetical protein
MLVSPRLIDIAIMPPGLEKSARRPAKRLMRISLRTAMRTSPATRENPGVDRGGGFHITSSLVRRIVGMGQSRIDLRGSLFKLTHFPFDPFDPLDSLEQKMNNVLLMFQYQEEAMLKTFVEEAAALASIALFVAMIAIWAQLIPQL